MASPIAPASPPTPSRHIIPPRASDADYRVRILRETELLDSSDMDPDFDRYTALAKRLFKVPIALVSLVDSERQWFKSRFGLAATETELQYAFCAYTVLPESPDVFTVLDARADPRFANNPLVTGPPHIRFYAGAALIVAGTKVGSLCVIDSEPKEELSMDDCMNLLDLGESVSSLIRNRRELALKVDKERANLMLDMTHNMRTPMVSVGVCMNFFNTVREKIASALEVTKSVPIDEFLVTLDDLNQGINRMNVVVESSIFLGNSVISSIGPSSTHEGIVMEGSFCRKSAIDCSLLKIISQTRAVLSMLNGADRMEWMIDEQNLLAQGRNTSFPDEAMYALMTSIDQLIAFFNHIIVKIEFRKDENSDSSNAVNNDDEFLDGKLFIKILASHKADKATEDSDRLEAKRRTQQGFTFSSIERVLKDVGGGVRHSLLGEETDERRNILIEFWVTCIIDKSKPEELSDKLKRMMIDAKAATVAHLNVTPPRTPPSSLTPPPPSQSLDNNKGINILLVDDSIAIQKAMSRWLGKSGFSVRTASNGRDGLELATTNFFDVAFVDFLMPVMSGSEMMRQHSAFLTDPSSDLNSTNTDMLIVGMSATADVREQDECFSTGMHFFMSKPPDLTLLTKILVMRAKYPKIDEILDALCDLVDEDRGSRGTSSVTGSSKGPTPRSGPALRISRSDNVDKEGGRRSQSHSGSPSARRAADASPGPLPPLMTPKRPAAGLGMFRTLRSFQRTRKVVNPDES